MFDDLANLHAGLRVRTASMTFRIAASDFATMIPRSGTRDSPVASRSITGLPNHGAKELTIFATFTHQARVYGGRYFFFSD